MTLDERKKIATLQTKLNRARKLAKRPDQSFPEQLERDAKVKELEAALRELTVK